MVSMGEWASTVGFTAGWRLIKTLPEGASYAAFDRIADNLWSRNKGGVVQLERNLRRVHPEFSQEQVRELSREGMRSYMRYWCEAFRLPTWSAQRITSTFHMHRRELMDQALASGQGAVMVPGHMANWDHAGAWGCLRYGGVTTVAERLKPEKLYDTFLAYRQAMGFEVLGLGDSDVMRTLIRRLKEGRLVALLGDRDLSGSGVHVELCGETASLPAGPALLSIMTGAPLHPVTMWFEDGKTCGYVHDRIEVPAGLEREAAVQVMTQQTADAFTSGIRQHSRDWHMLQKVWLADVDRTRVPA